MTFPPAPTRTVGLPLRRVGILVVAALVLVACTGSEETLGESGQEPPAETAEGETPAEVAQDGRDDSDLDGDLPFGEDDGVEETPPVPFDVDELSDLSAPEQVIAEVAAELPEDVATDNVLDTIEPIDAGIDVSTDRDGRTTNGAGELVGLDEPASLACANVEIALTALDEDDGKTAAEQITTAAERAGSSEMPSVQAWSEPLATSITDGAVTELAPLIGFISVCAEGGYEL